MGGPPDDRDSIWSLPAPSTEWFKVSAASLVGPFTMKRNIGTNTKVRGLGSATIDNVDRVKCEISGDRASLEPCSERFD